MGAQQKLSAEALRIVLVVAGLVASCTAAHGGGSAARALGAAGAAMSEQAQRQMDLEAAIELEKKKAEIEIAKEQRLRQLRQQPPPTNVAENDDAMQERLLEQAHPQWRRIVLSSAFHKWLATRQADFAKACRTTREAAVLSFCIDEFFGPPAVR